MAENSWPFYDQETTETQFSKWARVLGENGITSGLGVTPGTGMQVRLAAGFALVRGHAYENTSQLNLTVGAAPTTAGQTRKDALVLRMSQVNRSVVAAIKAGLANTSGGSLPALTQTDSTWEFLIAEISVPQGVAAITTAHILERLPMLGTRILVNIESNRPAASQVNGSIFYNLSNGRLQYSTGAAWEDIMQLGNTTGTLAVNRGGTGQTTTKQALRALGIYIQPTAPAHAVGRVWIPGPEPV